MYNFDNVKSLCWFYPLNVATRREIVEFDGFIFFEVAEEGHCGICESRINHVEMVRFRDNIKTRYEYLLNRHPQDARTVWAGVQKPEGDFDPETLLRQTFCL